MSQLIELFVIALAVWRIGNMLSDVNQPGPFGILDTIRHKAGVVYDEFSVAQPKTNFAKGLLCIKCNSVWFGFGFTLLYLLDPQAAFWLALPLALSAAAIGIGIPLGDRDYP